MIFRSKPGEELRINLAEKHADDTVLLEKIKQYQLLKGYKTISEEHNLKAGDTITFWGGYNNDIIYTSTIFAFDDEGLALVVWDCYWFPLKLSERLYEEPK